MPGSTPVQRTLDSAMEALSLARQEQRTASASLPDQHPSFTRSPSGDRPASPTSELLPRLSAVRLETASAPASRPARAVPAGRPRLLAPGLHMPRTEVSARDLKITGRFSSAAASEAGLRPGASQAVLASALVAGGFSRAQASQFVRIAAGAPADMRRDAIADLASHPCGLFSSIVAFAQAGGLHASNFAGYRRALGAAEVGVAADALDLTAARDLRSSAARTQTCMALCSDVHDMVDTEDMSENVAPS